MLNKKKNEKRGAVSTTQKPTAETLLAEAQRLGDDFERVRVPVEDLLVEAREMELARGDAPDLARRGYPLTAQMFERVKVFAELLSPNAAKEAAANEDPQDALELQEATRARLMQIREEWMLIARACGIDLEIFEINTRKQELLVGSMAEVVSKVRLVREQMADRERVDALIDEATELIECEKKARLDRSLRSSNRKAQVKTTMQLKRLMHDEMRHISLQGLAAYPGDVVRELSYGLERFDAAVSRSSKPNEASPPPPAPAEGSEVIS